MHHTRGATSCATPILPSQALHGRHSNGRACATRHRRQGSTPFRDAVISTAPAAQTTWTAQTAQAQARARSLRSLVLARRVAASMPRFHAIPRLPALMTSSRESARTAPTAQVTRTAQMRSSLVLSSRSPVRAKRVLSAPLLHLSMLALPATPMSLAVAIVSPSGSQKQRRCCTAAAHHRLDAAMLLAMPQRHPSAPTQRRPLASLMLRRPPASPIPRRPSVAPTSRCPPTMSTSRHPPAAPTRRHPSAPPFLRRPLAAPTPHHPSAPLNQRPWQPFQRRSQIIWQLRRGEPRRARAHRAGGERAGTCALALVGGAQ